MKEMLSQLKQHFELILFTSAAKDYGNLAIDIMEKDEKYFDFRLFKDDLLPVK